MNAFMNRHKLLFAILYVAMPLLLAYIGYLVHNLDVARRGTAALMERVTALTGSTSLYELPRVSMSMSSGVIGQAGTIKLDIGIEVKKSELDRIPDYEPRIVDHILAFMEKQDFNKLKQPSSAHWVRKGLEDAITGGALPINVAGIVINRMVFE